VLECWIIDKSIDHMGKCIDHAIGVCGIMGTAIRDHINVCDRCNQKYRIGIKNDRVKLTPQYTIEEGTRKMNQFRYSVPRDISRWIPTGKSN
jgi:hypothetical protein